MTTINELLKRPKVKTPRTVVTESKVTNLLQWPLIVRRRGRYLHRLYASLKTSLDGTPPQRLTSSMGIYHTFMTAAQRLQEFEQQTGIDVDDTQFVYSVFKHYGKHIYPGMLAGKSALHIFRAYQDRVSYMVVEAKSSVDNALLNAISSAWCISIDEVVRRFSKIISR